MLQVAKNAKGVSYDLVAAAGSQVRDETYTTRVVFETTVVKPLRSGRYHQHSCRHCSAVLRLLRWDDVGPAATCKLHRDYMTGKILTRANTCATCKDLVHVRHVRNKLAGGRAGAAM